MGTCKDKEKGNCKQGKHVLVDRTRNLVSCVRYGGDSLLATATEMLAWRVILIKQPGQFWG